MYVLLFILAAWLLCMAVFGIFKPGLVLRWGDPAKRTRGKAFGLYAMLGAACFVAFVLLAPTSQTTTTAEINLLPPAQQAFSEVVARYEGEYDSAANAIQKTELRTDRGFDMLKALGNQLVATRWVGVIKTIDTQTDGDAFLSIQPLESGYRIATWNNGLSDLADNTIIKSGSAVHDALRPLKEGDEVIFSGRFFTDDRFGLRETSMTEAGSMKQPEFLFVFTGLAPAQ